MIVVYLSNIFLNIPLLHVAEELKKKVLFREDWAGGWKGEVKFMCNLFSQLDTLQREHRQTRK